MTTDLSAATSDRTFCANHPDRETALRCNRCGKYICVKCARRTPTGYRCKECVNKQQQIFETALWYDYAIAVVVSAILSGIAGALVTFLGWFVFFLAPVAGGGIAEVVRVAVRKRRGKWLPWAATGGAVLGGLPLCALPMLSLLFSGGDLRALLGILWPTLYIVLAASTLYYRLRGIRIN
jgi:hypothetical protein